MQEPLPQIPGKRYVKEQCRCCDYHQEFEELIPYLSLSEIGFDPGGSSGNSGDGGGGNFGGGGSDGGGDGGRW